MRDEAASVVNLANWLFNLAVSLLFPILFDVNKGMTFFIFTGIGIASTIYLIFAYKETKGATPTEGALDIEQRQLLLD